ncbi:uncharacterized protein EMH_0035310 [Eimeria mitis]|uniref:Uncharacterized protein n=1 Tax=Eimeria mitis TaxID=44415 RepID=U6JWG5_9EIME|nr:uncharacterized protein EMH_0035310 [Eimeria mitis]CDJ27838.1 hypothetical protein EMH_0035310 [Eimeria mitis]
MRQDRNRSEASQLSPPAGHSGNTADVPMDHELLQKGCNGSDGSNSSDSSNNGSSSSSNGGGSSSSSGGGSSMSSRKSSVSSTSAASSSGPSAGGVSVYHKDNLSGSPPGSLQSLRLLQEVQGLPGSHGTHARHMMCFLQRLWVYDRGLAKPVVLLCFVGGHAAPPEGCLVRQPG